MKTIMNKTCILVLGPESSGGRIIKKVLLSCGCDGSSANHQKWDDTPPCKESLVVWHKSLPHGKMWPDLPAMIRELRANHYTVKSLVTSRDWFSMTASGKWNHALFFKHQLDRCRKAYYVIFKVLAESEVPFFVVSYEEFCRHPRETFAWIVQELEIPEPSFDFDLVTDGNAKYFEDFEASLAQWRTSRLIAGRKKRQRTMANKPKMLYGWCGEFGWEVMTVVPEINALQHNYDITLFNYKGGQGMYADMDVTYVEHDLEIRGAGYGMNYGKTQWQRLNLAQFDYDVLRIHYHPETAKIKFKKIPKIIRSDITPPKKRKVVIHARRFRNSKSGRNWTPKFNNLIEYIKEQGFEVVFIGVPECSDFIEGAGADCRCHDLGQTITHIKEARLVIGPSSGPMVLSLWCGTPVFTWSCSDTRMFHTDRGNRAWNPFGTKHYHPWSEHETEETIRKYKSAAYKPKMSELRPGLEFALRQENLL